jgi:hypothetical protein
MCSYFIVIDDIWDISVWNNIRCALPHNNCGYRIITTTRILNVAAGVGGAYKLEPLSFHNSRILFYRRIFGNEIEAKCLDDELAEISDKILEKCAGLPLAIITIASLLASKERNKLEWYNVYKSIGAVIKNNLDMENMRMVLLRSYYDLPSHLQTCLLYLSVFPEHCDIEKDRLIRLWIGERFIKCKKQGVSLFQVGEIYFNELINRSMIQPVYGWNSAVIEFCRIHSMVLDLICSLSSEENSVTILNNVDHACPWERVRRLSLQNANSDDGTPRATMSMKQLRSIVVFPSAVDLMPPPDRFLSLRILDLEGCHLSQGYRLKYIGKMFHLRYLGLRDTRIAQLPNEIGNLQFLQTLDIRGNEISSLPSTVAHLKGLMCLLIGSWTRIPEGIGNLSSLEELSTICISDSPNTIQELGHLTELRVLSIDCRIGWKGVSKTSLVGCLQKLQKIRRLSISVFGECNLDGWVAPQHLHRLELIGCWSSVLSSWMNPSLLLNLSFLSIEVKMLQQEDLDILGRLPALTCLDLEVNHENLGILVRLVVGASSFADLVHCMLRGSIGPVVFQQGAMPNLTGLCFTFPVHETKETANCNGGFDTGLENLKSLRDVTISFLYGGASEGDAEKAEAAFRHAVEIHPNRPTLQIR